MKHPSKPWLSHALRGIVTLSLTFLILEFFDETDYAIGGAAMPAMYSDLVLNYAQVGLLVGLPGIINTFVEPVLMLLGDTLLRKRIILGGGLVLAMASLLISGALAFPLLLVGFIFARIASGAFVSLSQASLMDLHPGRESHQMARWSIAGTFGNLIGPLILAGSFMIGFGWRPVYAGLALCYLVLTAVVWLQPFPARAPSGESQPSGIVAGGRLLLRNFWETARSPGLVRWIMLMQFADLMLDIFISYMPLYFVEIVGLSNSQVSLLLSTFILCSLFSDLVLIKLLDKFHGRSLVRASALAIIFLYSAWLIVPGTIAKVILVLLIPIVRMGWYPVLAGESYMSAPGRSASVKAVDSLGGLLGGGLAWGVGFFASLFGLESAMWLLLLGPLSLLLGMPRRGKTG